RLEPSTFAWIEPLDEIEPLVVERIVEKPVIQEREVVVERIVEKPVVYEKEVVVERIVEKPVIYEKEIAAARPAGDGGSGEKRTGLGRSGRRKASSSSAAEPKTIIIGRGPALTERLAKIAPSPAPVMAGACALLIALAGVALISPSGEQATAARSNSPLGVAEGGKPTALGPTGGETALAVIDGGAGRDPFAAKGFRPKTIKRPGAAGDAKSRGAAQNKKAKPGATPATATPSLYAANFITYSSYTPWAKIKRRSGGWIDFDGKPTVKVVSVSEKSVELFVVTDVEVLTDKLKSATYSYPLRTIKLRADGLVRFADYRDIEGDDVQYTIRFRGSLPLELTPEN
ncbi:MAG: hypothetical protein WAO61_06240, partial [Solirubrobacterales bacterium]